MKKNKLFTVILICIIMIAIGTVVFASDIINPDDYHVEPSVSSSGEAMDIVKTILGVVNVVGVIILVSTIALLGIKYITGTLEERAEYKKSMIPILIGAFLLFSTSTLINVVYNIFYEEGKEYTNPGNLATTRQSFLDLEHPEYGDKSKIASNTSTANGTNTINNTGTNAGTNYNTGTNTGTNTGNYSSSSSNSSSSSSSSSGAGTANNGNRQSYYIPDSAIQQKLNNETKEMQTKSYNGLQYLFKLPEGATTNMPIIIHLHGNGEASEVGIRKISTYVNSGSAYDSGKFIYIAPKAPISNANTWENYIGTIKALINEVVSQYGANKNKVILSGFSQGAHNAWSIINSNPNLFSAAVIVSGYPFVANQAYGCTSTPVWAFYGGNEPEYARNAMESAVNTIKSNGGNAKYEAIPGKDHPTIQDAVYGRQDVYSWLLSQ